MTIDPDKLAEAAAKMRRPEIRMHPDAVQQLGIANGVIRADDDLVLPVVHQSGIVVVADETVEPGRMWLVDADPVPVPTFLVPPPIERDVLEAVDQVRARWTTIGMDFGYSPGMATVATFEDGRCVSVRYIRRPWKLTGRAATRARWRWRGRGR